MKLATKALAAVAMLLSASATVGCIMWIIDEPVALDNMID